MSNPAYERLTQIVNDPNASGGERQQAFRQRRQLTPAIVAAEKRAVEARQDAAGAAKISEVRFGAEVEMLQVAIDRARGEGRAAEVERLMRLKETKFQMRHPDPRPVDGRMPR
jgi:hypothetical protein